MGLDEGGGVGRQREVLSDSAVVDANGLRGGDLVERDGKNHEEDGKF